MFILHIREVSEINNFEKYCNSPEKISTLTIEHDIEIEDAEDIDECLRVTTTYKGIPLELGIFRGTWELEDWLYSDLSFDEWRKNH